MLLLLLLLLPVMRAFHCTVTFAVKILKRTVKPRDNFLTMDSE